jgi:hypothetical protein
MKSLLCRLLLVTCLFPAAQLSAESIAIISRAEWNALEARPYREQVPVRFTVHHSAVHFDRERDAAQHIRNIQSWGMGEARNWTDIPYHYIIAPNGDIFEGRDPRVAGESNTPYDTSGHLQINLLGNFSEQDPTPEALESLVRLLAWANREFSIPTDTLKAHRDFAATGCPGDRLYRLVENGMLRSEADKRLASETRVRRLKRNGF